MVSIVIPVYNVEKYLRQCLDSVVCQTFKDIEIIIVDDGSQDNCGSICDEYAAKDKRITVIHQQNKGLSEARNAGIEAASGEYFMFIDSDDWVEPDLLKKLCDTAFENDADMCCCTHKRQEGKRVYVRKGRSEPLEDMEIYEGDRKIEAFIRDRRFTNTAWAKLFSAELFKELRFPPGRLYEDVFVMHRIVYAAKRIVNIKYDGYIYRRHSESITGRKYSDKQKDCVYSRYEQLEFVKKYCADLETDADSNVLDACRGLMFRLAADNRRYRETENWLQGIHREKMSAYMKKRHSFLAFAYTVIAFFSVPAARFLTRCLLKLGLRR